MKDDTDLSLAIRGVPAENYGESHSSHVLEMWKTYLGMADRISDRRERANAFFVTIHTAVFAGVGFLVEKQMFPWIATVCVFAGIPFAFYWYRLVRSYRDLNSAKFKVVHKMEELLPLKLFDAEWEAVGRGKDSKRYLPFTHIETKVPIIFIAVYTVITLVSLYMTCSASNT